MQQRYTPDYSNQVPVPVPVRAAAAQPAADACTPERRSSINSKDMPKPSRLQRSNTSAALTSLKKVDEAATRPTHALAPPPVITPAAAALESAAEFDLAHRLEVLSEAPARRVPCSVPTAVLNELEHKTKLLHRGASQAKADYMRAQERVERMKVAWENAQKAAQRGSHAAP